MLLAVTMKKSFNSTDARCHCYKTFFCVIGKGAECARVFVPCNALHPSLIYASGAEAYPSAPSSDDEGGKLL